MSTQATTGEYLTEQELRAIAIKRLKDKRDLKAHVLAYALVNGMLILIWAVTSVSFFWPVLPLTGWGIGLVFLAWDVYAPPDTPARVDAEMSRLRRE